MMAPNSKAIFYFGNSLGLYYRLSWKSIPDSQELTTQNVSKKGVLAPRIIEVGLV